MGCCGRFTHLRYTYFICCRAFPAAQWPHPPWPMPPCRLSRLPSTWVSQREWCARLGVRMSESAVSMHLYGHWCAHQTLHSCEVVWILECTWDYANHMAIMNHLLSQYPLKNCSRSQSVSLLIYNSAKWSDWPKIVPNLKLSGFGSLGDHSLSLLHKSMRI